MTSSDDTDSEISTDIDGEDASDTDTNVVDETSSGDDTDVTNTIDAHTTDENSTDENTDLTIDATQKPLYQNLECEPLDETWMCSSGSKNHSLCIKFCTVGLDLSHVQSYLMIYNRSSKLPCTDFSHVKIQTRWSIRTKEMYVQAKRMLLGSKKSKMSDNDR